MHSIISTDGTHGEITTIIHSQRPFLVIYTYTGFFRHSDARFLVHGRVTAKNVVVAKSGMGLHSDLVTSPDRFGLPQIKRVNFHPCCRAGWLCTVNVEIRTFPGQLLPLWVGHKSTVMVESIHSPPSAHGNNVRWPEIEKPRHNHVPTGKSREHACHGSMPRKFINIDGDRPGNLYVIDAPLA